MGTFQVETLINAPVSVVWKRLAGDIGTIAEWNPGVKASSILEGAPAKTGLGAQRHCDLGAGNHLDETVVKFVEGEAITFRITETNLPFARADIRFTLTPTPTTKQEGASFDATKVTCSPVYKLKYGCIGEILDKCMVKRTYKRGMANLLTGLKEDVEAATAE